MANEVKGHIKFDERTTWNTATSKINAHIAGTDGMKHVPSPPPTSSGNYYLGNDLTWHKVPSVSL